LRGDEFKSVRRAPQSFFMLKSRAGFRFEPDSRQRAARSAGRSGQPQAGMEFAERISGYSAFSPE
jgi:hypothetical protein